MSHILTVTDSSDDEILYQEVASSEDEARRLALAWLTKRYPGEFDDVLTGDLEEDYSWLLEYSEGAEGGPRFTIRESGA